jgi:hypothetical protein
MTDDKDLKLLCDLINEKPEGSTWKKVLEDKNLTIHKKTVKLIFNVV